MEPKTSSVEESRQSKGGENGKNINKKPKNGNNKRRQPRKDSRSKRINLDNERISRLKRDASNDVTWYARNPELLAASASLPSYAVVGERTPFTGSQTVPGAMALYWSPAFAGFDDNAINQAKDSMYSFQVHANSRNQSYDSNDLMILHIAGINVFTTLAHVIRAYGTAKYYSEMNRYLPDALLTLMGFDPKDVRANLSNMWFDINEMVSRTTQIWIPNTMPVLTRQYWMNTNIYTDTDSLKPQLYMYVPATFYRYMPTAFNDGGSVLPIQWNDVLVNRSRDGVLDLSAHDALTLRWNEWKNLINAQISALINDQDRGIIYGDVLKAFGPEKIFSLTSIPVDYRITFSYNPEVLSQFENVTALPNAASKPRGMKQNQDALKLVQLWSAQQGSPDMIGEHSVLNFHSKTPPTPADIMVASRMHAGGAKASTASILSWGSSTGWTVTKTVVWLPDSCGTEVCEGIKVAVNAVSSTGLPEFTSKVYATNVGSSNPTFDKDAVLMMMSFDWSPWIYWCTGQNPSPTTTSVASETKFAYGEYDNYIFVSNSELRKMNTAAIYSEFGVPYI